MGKNKLVHNEGVMEPNYRSHLIILLHNFDIFLSFTRCFMMIKLARFICGLSTLEQYLEGKNMNLEALFKSLLH